MKVRGAIQSSAAKTSSWDGRSMSRRHYPDTSILSMRQPLIRERLLHAGTVHHALELLPHIRWNAGLQPRGSPPRDVEERGVRQCLVRCLEPYRRPVHAAAPFTLAGLGCQRPSRGRQPITVSPSLVLRILRYGTGRSQPSPSWLPGSPFSLSGIWFSCSMSSASQVLTRTWTA